jgi:3,4-dihydroxy 2-butanone 4-phosphate synthase / GTP cyclohydrolase II
MSMTTSTQAELNLERIGEFPRPTPLGSFDVVCYEYGAGRADGAGFAFAVSRGALPADDLLVRVQSPCLFGEAFLVNSCDCGDQLRRALAIGAASESFLLVYLTDQEGRGLGMRDKIRAVDLEVREKVDMLEAVDRLGLKHDRRDYGVAAQVIRDLNGDRPICLMTNNPKKQMGLAAYGIRISELVPLVIAPPNDECARYLAVKKHKMDHILPGIP